MSNDAGDDRPLPHSPWRLHFSLLALFVFITLVCLLLGWWVQPERVVATALFHVNSETPTILRDESAQQSDERNFEIVKKTQLAALKSYFVLQAAARKPGIASLPVFYGSDPVEWLQDNLDAEFPEDAEILQISLRGVQSQAQDLVKIVDAVAKAYQDEVISKERQRHLATRDLLARSLDNLNNEITRKWEELIDIARESGRPGILGDKEQQELDIRLLDQIEIGLPRLDEEQLEAERGGEVANVERLEERITQLRAHQSLLKERMTARAEVPIDLLMRRQDLEQLLRLADELAMKLERLEIDAQAPPRIYQLQPAVVGPDD